MKIINLGGVGGCVITQAIQQFISNQERYPYDWLLANQSFVIRTLLDNGEFFDLDDETELHRNSFEFSIKERDGMIVHDFYSYEHYINQRDAVKETYKRRFDRLNLALASNEPILFVRMSNHTPMNDNWIDRFESRPDDIPRWFDFIIYLEKYFKKPIYLLIVTTVQAEYNDYKDKLPNTGRFHLRMYDNRDVNGNDENIRAVANILYEVYEKVRNGSNV
jgi:hypothetical protein